MWERSGWTGTGKVIDEETAHASLIHPERMRLAPIESR